MINYQHININKIADFIRSGEKSCDNKCIGIECEHFIVDKDSKAISYYGEKGIEKILEKLSIYYPEKTFSQGHLIGLNSNTVYITLEPAGQIEVSIIPLNNLNNIKKLYLEFTSNINSILCQFEYRLVNYGYQPVSKVDDLQLIPKQRYEIMDKFFLSIGEKSRYMMRGSSSVQVNIDYEDEIDFINKFTLANLLSPLFYLITDNSNIFEGNLYTKNALRAYVWENVDNSRCGVLSCKSYNDYASWLYSTNPIFINKNNTDIYCDILKNSEIFNKDEISIDEIKHIMSMVFPNVRVKQFIEIRPGDSMECDFLFSYAALIKGIFYNKNAVDELNSMFKNLKKIDIGNQILLIQEKGFMCDYYGYDMLFILKKIYSLAELGLRADEKELLKPLMELNLSMKSPKSLNNTEVAAL